MSPLSYIGQISHLKSYLRLQESVGDEGQMMTKKDGARDSEVKKKVDLADSTSQSSMNVARTNQGSPAQWARQNYAPFSHLMFPRSELDRTVESEAVQRTNVE